MDMPTAIDRNGSAWFVTSLAFLLPEFVDILLQGRETRLLEIHARSPEQTFTVEPQLTLRLSGLLKLF